MKFALIICTYNRPKSIARLLVSIESQNLLPDEIIVVDGSELKDKTLADNNFKVKLTYYHVSAADRGLTKQRNFGLSKVSHDMDVICFLDDDVDLNPDYFQQVINTFISENRSVGVGGYAINEVQWNFYQKESKVQRGKFYCDGYFREEPLRDRLRSFFGLNSDLSPGNMPSFGHGRSSLPPSGQNYEVDLLIGMAMSFKKSLFEKIQTLEIMNQGSFKHFS